MPLTVSRLLPSVVDGVSAQVSRKVPTTQLRIYASPAAAEVLILEVAFDTGRWIDKLGSVAGVKVCIDAGLDGVQVFVVNRRVCRFRGPLSGYLREQDAAKS